MIPSSGCPLWPPDHPRTLPRTGTPTPPRGARPEDGAVRGYGVIRRCRTGFKVGPLVAETEDGADGLFRSLVAEADSEPVFLDIPEPNPRRPGPLQSAMVLRPCSKPLGCTGVRIPSFRSRASLELPPSNSGEVIGAGSARLAGDWRA